MIKEEEFSRYFLNKSRFFEPFSKSDFPIKLPPRNERKALVTNVYISIVSGRYAPSIPEIEVISNKGHGVSRICPMFCIEDYIVYYFCIKELEEYIAVDRTPNTFGGWSLGGKLRKKEEDEVAEETTDYGRYAFNPLKWVEVYKEYNARLYAQLDQERFSHVLHLDLANFYDCIRLDILERWIREEARREKGWIITLLFYLLNYWNRRNSGLNAQIVGLPQEIFQDCSRLLANFYLQEYDKYARKICLEMDAEYFRYADDQAILFDGNPEKMENILFLLSQRLNRYGLNINQKKVCIWPSEELQKHRFRIFMENLHKAETDKSLLESFIKDYLSLPADYFADKWKGGAPILKRLLNKKFKLEELPINLLQEIISRFLNKSFLLSSIGSYGLYRIYDLNQKIENPMIHFPEYVQELVQKTFHNDFHYAALAFARKIEDQRLISAIERRMQEVARPHFLYTQEGSVIHSQVAELNLEEIA